MADNLTPVQRNKAMAAVKGKNTSPELLLRSALHARGFRFRIHRADLPGKPDIVMPKYRTVIFVNGCFWHQHSGCRKATIPVTNVDYWREKLSRNMANDTANRDKLVGMGWRPIVVWGCQLCKERLPVTVDDVISRITEVSNDSFLSDTRA